MKEGTAYVDHINGHWEAWHCAEGRNWPLGYYGAREDALEYCRKKRFAKVVDITYTANDGGHIVSL